MAEKPDPPQQDELGDAAGASTTAASCGSASQVGGAAAGAAGPGRSWEKHLKWAMNLSWVVNWLLLGMKIVAYVVSHSKAVLASLADSGVDLASQLVLALAEHKKDKFHPRYPVGRARLEALAVIACACIMSVASLEVIQYAATDIYEGAVKGALPEVDLSPLMFAILGGGTAMKLALYFYCHWLQNLMSNSGAIVAAIIVRFVPGAWWVDPAAAIAISLIIAIRWARITWQQVRKLVGQAAPEEIRSQLEQLAANHPKVLTVDKVIAYAFGNRYFAELEVLLPPDMTVKESHDIALQLQQQVEECEEVERAFVHIDYESRQEPEHKLEREMVEKYQQKKKAKEDKKKEREARKASRTSKRGGSESAQGGAGNGQPPADAGAASATGEALV